MQSGAKRAVLSWAVVAAVAIGCGKDRSSGSTDDPPPQVGGFGESPEPPQGTPVPVPPEIVLEDEVTGRVDEACSQEIYGSGTHVTVCVPMKNEGTTDRELELPCGTVFLSRSPEAQHGLLLQRVTVTVPALTTKRFRIHSYCANEGREASSPEDSYDIGPVSDEPEIVELCQLLADKLIAPEAQPMVQTALWEITNGTGLSSELREALENLPTP